MTYCKCTKEQLEKSLTMTRFLINSMTNGALLLDKRGVILAANDAIARYLGKPVDRLVNTKISQSLSPEDKKKWGNRWNQFMDEGKPIHFSESCKERDYDLCLHPLFDAEGQLDQIAFISCDVTEHKNAEEALKRSRREWMTIFQAIGHPTVIMDPEHRIVQVNQAVCRILGKSEQELIGTTCFQWFHSAGSKHPPSACPLQQMLVSGNMETAEMDMEALGGNYIVSCTPVFDETARLQKIIHIATDVTYLKKSEEEKKKLQKQLLHVQKMEAVGTLTGGIAHDFNNILMGIQGYISLLLHDLNANHPHRAKLENIESYVRRGADLTKQLLGFARGGKYDVKPTNMNDLLANSAELFGRTRKEICISKRFEKDLWPVDVDQGQMDQVFLNLFINASQAMPGGGNLTLETDNCVFDKTDVKPIGIAEGRYVKISVSDDGIGMDGKTQERVFEPFFTTKPKGAGSGLGLASAYGIIKNHGGGIHVFSEPGRGTTFNIYVPSSESQPAVGKKQDQEIFTGWETIMLVDDEHSNISVMTEMLEMLHYRVLPVGSGQEAVAVYMEKGKEIDLVILDMIMPGISGGRTFDILREIDPNVAVILASGYSVQGEARAIIKRGCRGFLQKPFQLDELSRKVREILNTEGGRKSVSDPETKRPNMSRMPQAAVCAP
jgi:two-component system cell cycle sensor histidine kinase/response regulator CckA